MALSTVHSHKDNAIRPCLVQWCIPVISVLRRLRQKDSESVTHLGYAIRLPKGVKKENTS